MKGPVNRQPAQERRRFGDARPVRVPCTSPAKAIGATPLRPNHPDKSDGYVNIPIPLLPSESVNRGDVHVNALRGIVAPPTTGVKRSQHPPPAQPAIGRRQSGAQWTGTFATTAPSLCCLVAPSGAA